jgi:predicted nucleic acid-binding protein
MKLAVTDACIFIDIYELDLTIGLFSLPIEIHTTSDIFRELYPEQQKQLLTFQEEKKFHIHHLSANDRQIIFEAQYPKGLSDNDKTVIHLAHQIDAMVLSSDKAVRHLAKKQSIEYHGMLWVLDQLIASNIISKSVASQKLKQLINKNTFYKSNVELLLEMDKRLKIWEEK